MGTNDLIILSQLLGLNLLSPLVGFGSTLSSGEFELDTYCMFIPLLNKSCTVSMSLKSAVSRHYLSVLIVPQTDTHDLQHSSQRRKVRPRRLTI